MRRLVALVLSVASVLLATGRAQAQGSEGDAAPLVSALRIASRPTAERAAWTAYLAASRASRLLDSALVVRELQQAGRATWTTPPITKDFRLSASMTPAWFRTDAAARVAQTIVSFQTPSGGWAKHVDMLGAPRKPGESFFSETAGWDYIATIDNGATVVQLDFLAKALAERAEPVWRDAFLRGIGYLLRAQYPGGGWPQVYPLQGGYHDATTYNDDATVGVLVTLRDASRGAFPWLDAATRRAAGAAFDRGIAGILADQVVVNGQRTVWGQQHDPFTREPVRARSYELVGLTGGESTGILELLMSLEHPSAEAVRAVHAGATWLRAHPIPAVRYDSIAGSYVRDSAAGATWARIYEIPSFRPVMSNRDGVPRYDFSELTDRRTGYAWFIQRPAGLFPRYDAWSRVHPSKGH